MTTGIGGTSYNLATTFVSGISTRGKLMLVKRLRGSYPHRQSLQIVVFAWVAFVAFGAALALLTPLGEGFDEPWHFAYIQRIAQALDVPMGHSAFISEEVAQFLRVHPVSWGLHSSDSSLVSYEEYWNDEPAVYDKANRSIQDLRFSGKFVEANGTLGSQYERHQPPLYYLLTAPIFALAAHYLSFVNVFFVVRLWSVLIASLVVPGAYLLARGVFADFPWTKSILLLTVLFPGLYSGVVRVSNDALAVPVACWLLACLIGFLQTQRRAFLLGVCILLAVGLWTKAFFIPLFVGTLAVLIIYRYFREALNVVLGASIGIVWYLHNFLWTGSMTGLPETVLSGSSVSTSVAALGRLDWLNVANVVRFSHIWIGNWSFLNVRGWMYQIISWMFLLAIAGCIGGWRLGSQRRALLALSVNYTLFLAALVYYATQVFQHTGTSVAEGWYLTSMIPTEAVLFAAGVRSLFPRRWPACVGVFGLFLLVLNIYGDFFVMFPYYAGFTAHASSGHLQTYHASTVDLRIILERLLRFQPWLPRLAPLALIGIFVSFGLWWIITLMPVSTVADQ
jgi:hypothetical protein